MQNDGFLLKILKHPTIVYIISLTTVVGGLFFDTVKSYLKVDDTVSLGIIILIVFTIIISNLIYSAISNIKMEEKFEKQLDTLKDFIKEINKMLFNTIKENLEKGKKYKYFLPNNKEIIGKLKIYLDKHKEDIKYPKQVQVCLIPEDKFHFFTEIVIYKFKNNEPKGFMWFPHKMFNYYLEIDKKFLYNLYGSLESLENEYTMIDI